MNPLKYAQMMKYLTRAKKEKPDLPDVFSASKAPIPKVREDVETIEAINRFVRDNPVEKAEGGRIELGEGGGKAFRLKQLQEDYNKFGKSKLDKGAKVLGFKNYAAMEGQDNANFRRKIRTELTQFGEVLTESGSRKRSRETRIPKEQGIQIKLLEATNSKDFFDPKAFAKANKISMATLKDQAERLQTNIYKKRIVDSKTALGIETRDKLEWIPKDSKFSDNALSKLWKSKLIQYERNKIDNIFFDAFGRAPTKKNPNPTYNPKKFLAIKKNLNEYRQLKKAINKRFPNIDFELDHPLSKSSLNKLFNATTDQLTRVNVLDADLNNGFKDTLSLQYEKAMGDPKKGIKPNLNKKKAVEKIARDLKLNIGKISDDATNFKYGVKEFQKLNIKDEIAKSLENLSSLNKNFQDYAKKNPELFKIANVSTQQTFTQIKPSELKSIQNIIASFGDGNCSVTFGKKGKKDGGRIGYQTGTPGLNQCFASGARNFNDGKFKTADQIQDGVKLLRGGRAVLSAISKYGIVPELAYVGLEAAGRTILGEQPTNALLKSIDTLTFGATDFTSEIEAEKFGEYAKDKLAVDKFQESQAKVRSILDNISRLEEINLEGGETDVTQNIQTLKAQLQSASDELRANTVNPDIVQFITQRGDEIADAQLAKSPFAQQSLTDQLEGFPGIKDYTDTEATRVFPFQQTQKQLNEKVLQSLSDVKDIMQYTTSDAIDLAQMLRADGQNISAKSILDYRDSLRNAPLSELAQSGNFSPESIYGANAVFSTPLPGGALEKKPNVIPEMEKEIVGQTNVNEQGQVINPFDIDLSMIGSGLRGFSAAEGGVASGPPPVRGPNPQGLLSLKNRVRNY